MRDWQSQAHVRWYCRYHIVFVPKYRKKTIYGRLRKDIGGMIRDLCKQTEVEVVEGHAMPDHIHLCLSIPPKFSIASTVGRLKGKSAILTELFLEQGKVLGRRVLAQVRSGLGRMPCSFKQSSFEADSTFRRCRSRKVQ